MQGGCSRREQHTLTGLEYVDSNQCYLRASLTNLSVRTLFLVR